MRFHTLNRPDAEYRIPDTVETIADHAFAFSEGGCYQLQKVFIPDSVTRIGDPTTSLYNNVVKGESVIYSAKPDEGWVF